MQGRNGNANIENRLTDTVREGKSGTNGESSIDIYTLPCMTLIAGEKLQALCDDLERWGGGWGGRLKREVIYMIHMYDMCMMTVDLHCHMAEPITIL